MKNKVKVFYKNDQAPLAFDIQKTFRSLKWQAEADLLLSSDQVKMCVGENKYRFLIVVNPSDQMTVYDSLSNTVSKKDINDWVWMEAAYESRH